MTYEELESKLWKAEYDLAEMQKFTDDLIKQKVDDERNRIIKAILNIPELGAGVTLSHPATSEQVTLRDKIINICKGT